MKRWLLAVAASFVLMACLPEAAPPTTVELVAVVDTRGHVLSIVLVQNDGSTVRYDANTGRDMREAVALGSGLPEEKRYVVMVPCPDIVAAPPLPQQREI